MTLNEAITKLDSLKPNQYDYPDKVCWISDVDGRIYKEIILKHENPDEISWEPYTRETTPSLELLAYEPYTDLYIAYMAAQVDNYNGEFTRYNNDIQQFNDLYQAFADDYNKNNKTAGVHKFSL